MGFFQEAANKKQLRKLNRQFVQPTLKQIKCYAKLSDAEIQQLSINLKETSKNDRKTTITAFALACEASKRTLGLEPFATQILAAAALHCNMIIEMKTGEGKTLSAAIAAYRKSLDNRGVHVVTVNDYLAQRDCKWMSVLYQFLGCTSSAIYHTANPEQRASAYKSDITYGTNNEFGFDYLRDQMVFRAQEQVQRELCHVIIDEADSILIDEARTPLIISGADTSQEKSYVQVQQCISAVLKNPEHYTFEAKERTASLTELGNQAIEQLLSVDNLYSLEHVVLLNQVEQAVIANLCFQKDEHYLVEDAKVKIVDEFTGRLAEGRQWSDGLQQAVEAKESVSISPENHTHATITFQHYFKMYPELCGMTGTIMTEKAEIEGIYGVSVIEIPTKKAIQRVDETDIIYKSRAVKQQHIIKTISDVHKTGQPILVGTATVAQAEELSKLLTANNIKHNVLSAKHHNAEAHTIAQAGRLNAITVATHLAGRGTDIILGGDAEDLIQALPDYATMSEKERSKTLIIMQHRCCAEAEQVKQLGGLFVLGTERHEARRIDNQLRGRSGRQGDVGRSLFILSAEDDLIRAFSGEKLEKLFSKLNIDENFPLQNKIVVAAIQRAQSQIESTNFSMRKQLFEFDQVLNQQRTAIYAQRQQILESSNNYTDLLSLFDEACQTIVQDSVDKHCVSVETSTFENLQMQLLGQIFVQSRTVQVLIEDASTNKHITEKQLVTMLKEKAQYTMLQTFNQVTTEAREQIARMIFLQTLDKHWTMHLTAIDGLRTGIKLQSYAQKKPLDVFKTEGYHLFMMLITNIKYDATKLLLQLRIRAEAAPDSTV